MDVKSQDGPPQWLDIQQGQVHTTLAFPPCQVVTTILLSLLCHVVMTDPMTDPMIDPMNYLLTDQTYD